jgi:hypothetical protein
MNYKQFSRIDEILTAHPELDSAPLWSAAFIADGATPTRGADYTGATLAAPDWLRALDLGLVEAHPAGGYRLPSSKAPIDPETAHARKRAYKAAERRRKAQATPRKHWAPSALERYTEQQFAYWESGDVSLQDLWGTTIAPHRFVEFYLLVHYGATRTHVDRIFLIAWHDKKIRAAAIADLHAKIDTFCTAHPRANEVIWQRWQEIVRADIARTFDEVVAYVLHV